MRKPATHDAGWLAEILIVLKRIDRRLYNLERAERERRAESGGEPEPEDESEE